MMTPEFDFSMEEDPILSPSKEPEYILVRAPTIKKSYKIRTPVHLSTLERVFSLSSPYLISTKTKETLTHDEKGIFRIPHDQTDYVIMGKKTQAPSAIVSAPTSSSSSFSASSSSAASSSSPEKPSEKAHKKEKQPKPSNVINTAIPTNPTNPTTTTQSEKATWDDLEEDLAEDRSPDLPQQPQQRGTMNPQPERRSSSSSSASSSSGKLQPQQTNKFPAVTDFSDDDDEEQDNGGGENLNAEEPQDSPSSSPPPSLIAPSKSTSNSNKANPSPPKSTSNSLPQSEKMQQVQKASPGQKGVQSNHLKNVGDFDEDNDDDDDDFELIDASPQSTPSVAITWQEQLQQLQEAYRTMEVENHAQFIAEKGHYLAENAQYYLAETAGVMKSVYTFVRNPLTNNYTALEQTQMRAIQSIYRSTLGEDIPFELKIDSEFLRPATKVSVEDLSKNTWVRTLGDGHLSQIAEDLVTTICHYQHERYNRAYWHGYLDDPTNLLLDEMKRWLVSFVSKTPLDNNALKKVQGRISYLADLLAADIFQPGAGSQTTMKMVLVNCKKSLEEVALPIIQQELLNSSARDHLDQLIKYTRMTLHHCVIYLFYVLRSNPEVPNNCTLDNIRNPASKDLTVALNTGSGACLRALVSSEPFNAIFQAKNTQPAESNEVSFPSAGNVGLRNAFISQQGEAIIPEVIGTVGENAKMIMKENSGIQSTFQQKFVIDAFVRFHGLLQELAFAMMLILQAKALAGVGGELLVYGMANRQMNMVIRVYHKLIEALETCMKTIDEVGKSRYEELVFQNNNQDKVWPRHFSISSSLKNRIEADLANSMKAAKIVGEHANEKQIQERVKSAKAQTEQFSSDASKFCSKVSSLLSLRSSDFSGPLPSHFAITYGSE